ncbi:hypothetical protein D3C72_1460750 [compost metagenome]
MVREEQTGSVTSQQLGKFGVGANTCRSHFDAIGAFWLGCLEVYKARVLVGHGL